MTAPPVTAERYLSGMNLPSRLWRRLGGWLGIVDTLIHKRPLAWVVPDSVQDAVCARFDRKIRSAPDFDGPTT